MTTPCLKLLNGVKIYSTSHHFWLRAMQHSSSSTNPYMRNDFETIPKTWSTGSPIQCNKTTVHQHIDNKNTDPWSVEIGITKRGFDDIGDVFALNSTLHMDESTELKSLKALLGRQVNTGDKFMKMEWDGQTITEADELYHTVWETIDGFTDVISPVNGYLEHVFSFSPNVGIDEDTVLATIRTSRKDLETVLKNDKFLMAGEEYNQFVSKLPPGMFAESN